MKKKYVFTKNHFYCKASGLTTFFVFRRKRKDHGLHNCPWEKQSLFEFKPQTCKDWPCTLLMVLANERSIGSRLEFMSVGMSGIHGSSSSSPLWYPIRSIASNKLFINSTINRVPLHNLGWFMSNIIGAPIFIFRLCDGNPGSSRELRNSISLLHFGSSQSQWICMSLFHRLEWIFRSTMIDFDNLFWCFGKPWLLILLLNSRCCRNWMGRWFFLFLDL